MTHRLKIFLLVPHGFFEGRNRSAWQEVAQCDADRTVADLALRKKRSPGHVFEAGRTAPALPPGHAPLKVVYRSRDKISTAYRQGMDDG